MGAVLAGLNDLMTRESWLGVDQVDGIKLAPDTLEARKSAGGKADAAQKRRANRDLLEDAFPAQIASSRRLTTKSEKDRWAYLPAGSYWLVPIVRASLGQRVDVQAGETLDAESQTDNVIVLKFRHDEKTAPESILLTLKTPKQMQEVIGRIRRDDLLRGETAFPRVEASKEDIASALALARRDFAKYCSEPGAEITRDLKPEQVQELKGNYWRARSDAERIFAAVGEERDIDLVVSSLLAKGNAFSAAALVAYMENRLGLLEKGSLVKALNGKDPAWALAAAVQLHASGIHTGDASLIASLNDPSPKERTGAELACFGLLNMPDKATLEAVRNLTIQLEKNKEFTNSQWHLSGNPLVPAMLYLMAYGDKDDWKRIASHEVGAYGARFLAYLTDDPTPLARFLIAKNEQFSLRSMTPALRTIPERTEALATAIENAVYAGELSRSGASGSGERMDAAGLSYDFGIGLTFWRPYQRAAELLSASASWDRPPEGAFPLPWHAIWDDSSTPWLAWPLFRMGVNSYAVRRPRQLDYFPRDEILKRFAALPDKEKIFAQDLFTAAYRATTCAFYTNRDNYHDGLERRPYLLRKPDPGKGAISGVLSTVPLLSGRTLHLPLRLEQRVYYIKRNMFDDFNPETLDIYPYVSNNGRKLVSAIRLHRGETTFPVTEHGADQNGNLLFEAELDKPALNGLYLEVDFLFFEQTHHLIFDLFASDYARQRREGH